MTAAVVPRTLATVQSSQKSGGWRRATADASRQRAAFARSKTELVHRCPESAPSDGTLGCVCGCASQATCGPGSTSPAAQRWPGPRHHTAASRSPTPTAKQDKLQSPKGGGGSDQNRNWNVIKLIETKPLRKHVARCRQRVQHGFWAMNIMAVSKPKPRTISNSNPSNRDLPAKVGLR